MAIRMAVYRGTPGPDNRIAFEKCKSIADATTKAESLYAKVEGKWNGYIQVVSDNTGYVYEEFVAYEHKEEA